MGVHFLQLYEIEAAVISSVILYLHAYFCIHYDMKINTYIKTYLSDLQPFNKNM